MGLPGLTELALKVLLGRTYIRLVEVSSSQIFFKTGLKYLGYLMLSFDTHLSSG